MIATSISVLSVELNYDPSARGRSPCFGTSSFVGHLISFIVSARLNQPGYFSVLRTSYVTTLYSFCHVIKSLKYVLILSALEIFERECFRKKFYVCLYKEMILTKFVAATELQSLGDLLK